MNHRTTEWIRRHPIAACFLLGIAMCYVTLFPALVIIPQDTDLGRILSLYLARIGAHSLVLPAMLLARIIRSGRQHVPLARRLSIFLPVWFIAVVIHTASLWVAVPPGTSPVLLIVLSLPAALLPAFAISSGVFGADGVKHMLSTLVRPKGSIVYYLVALLTFPVLHIVGTGITSILDGKGWFPQVSQGADLSFTPWAGQAAQLEAVGRHNNRNTYITEHKSKEMRWNRVKARITYTNPFRSFCFSFLPF